MVVRETKAAKMMSQEALALAMMAVLMPPARA